MIEVYLLTGSNMGDKRDYLSRAAKAIEEKCGSVTKKSSIYETAAWGIENQDDFLNQIIAVETKLDPFELLETILKIEEKLGRKRKEKYGPRIIDIDILLYNNRVINEPGLKIPHPRLHERRFVLEPLAEIAAHKLHPVFQQSITTLLAECTDPLKVNKIN